MDLKQLKETLLKRKELIKNEMQVEINKTALPFQAAIGEIENTLKLLEADETKKEQKLDIKEK